MKLHTKLIWLLAGLFLLLLGLFIYILLNKSRSSFTITASQNKFNVKFQISKYDQKSAQSYVQDLGLAKNILDGLQFELDGTSSAKLAYILPIKANLKFQKEKLELTGTTQASQLTDAISPDQNFKAPKEFSVALFGPNLLPLVEKRLTPTPDFKDWLNTNLKNTSGEYLFLFKNMDLALIFKEDSPLDFENLKSQISPNSYKEETQDNITFHLVENYVFFQSGDHIFVTSSLESAKDLEESQKGILSKTNIFGNDPITIAILIQNSPDKKADSALKFLLGDEQKISGNLDKIKTVRVFLKDNEFSGSIELLK